MLPLFYLISHYSNLPFRAWEQRKLGEIANSFEYGLNASSKTYDGENKYIRITDIDESSHVFNQDNLTSPNISLEKLNHYLLEEGDILLARTGASTGKSYYYSKMDGKVFFAGFLIRAKIKQEYNVSFIFQNTLTERYNNFIQVTSQRSGQPGINAQEYARFALYIPELKEQQKIGVFFKQLDNTIALHQRKLDTLKLMKKGFLQRMFPNNEEEIPKVRFADFDGMWKQRKLNSITEKITRKNKELESTLPLTISAQDGLIDQNEYFNKIIASRNIRGYFLVKNGEFAYNKSYSKGYPWGVVKRLDNYNMGVLSTLYIIFKPVKINSDFLTKYFDSTYWYRAVSQFATEGARNHGLLNIAASDFFEIELNIPLNNEEQKKIGLFFQQLENIIILHQNKLEKLSILKKTYLKKMFI
ncbi:restriction endonuclease subunit S [Listeria monocytogenes]|nr:restriction endonuclease subunit S [Listeria monocytogenes]